jgi:hypothetical protein
VLKIASFLGAVLPIWFAVQMVTLSFLGSRQSYKPANSYWRFISVFCPMSDNLGRIEQAGHFVQFVQSSINTGDYVVR